MKEREFFTFYRSYWDALKELPNEAQRNVLAAICDFALDGKEPDFAGIEKVVWTLIRPSLLASWTKFENGCKGGAPMGNRNAAKTTEKQPKDNLNLTEIQAINNKEERTKNKEKIKKNKEDIVVGDESPDQPTIPFVEVELEEVKPTHQTKKFVPPTLEQVQGYIVEKGLQNVDAERFFYFYESNGWKVGRNQMKSWQMALLRWDRDDNNNRSNSKANQYGRNAVDAKSERDAELAEYLNSKLEQSRQG